jgi:hypothetical protein
VADEQARPNLSHLTSRLQESTGSDAQPESRPPAATRVTSRTLRTVLATAEWATVQEGFVLHLYSQEEVARAEQKLSDYEKRRREYLDKLAPLNDRKNQIHGRQNFARGLTMARMMFSRYDTNKDGRLQSAELSRARTISEQLDSDGDGELTLREVTISMLSRTNPPDDDEATSPESATEKWNKLLDESDSLQAKLDDLKQQYQDVQNPAAENAFYEVVEVAQDFIRLKHTRYPERILPFTAIREIRIGGE